MENFITYKEGDLYKEVPIFDKTFRLLYGYYESFERESPLNDPIPIYPDFIKEPHYTAEGIPIATAMQNVCEFFNEKTMKTVAVQIVVFFKNTMQPILTVLSPISTDTSPLRINWVEYMELKALDGIVHGQDYFTGAALAKKINATDLGTIENPTAFVLPLEIRLRSV